MASVTYLNPPSAPPAGMYSHVAIAEPGRFAFIAGQLALDAKGNVQAPDDFVAQVPVVFDQLGRILKDLGADFSSVVQYTTYLVGADKREAWNNGRAEIFSRIYPDKRYPPNTLLIISALARPGALLEISAIARLPG